MKRAISKFTHKTNPSKLSLFSAIRNQQLTNRSVFETQQFKHAYTDEVYLVLESHLERLDPAFTRKDDIGYGKEAIDKKIYDKQLDCLEKLRKFALLGAPQAIDFYIHALPTYQYIPWLRSHVNGDHLCNKFLTDAKEVALYHQRPDLLLQISEKRITSHFIDIEDYHFCLKTAAEMEDMQSSVAAYTLAALYVLEMRAASRTTGVPNFDQLTRKIVNLFETGQMSDERTKRNLQALCKMGSVAAKEALLRLSMATFVDANNLLGDMKELCTTYFNLMLEKSKEAPANVFDEKCELQVLLRSRASVEDNTNEVDYYQNYYDLLKQSANEGRVGAIYAIFLLETSKNKKSSNQKIVGEMANKLTLLAASNRHPAAIHAAEKIVIHYYNKSKSVQDCKMAPKQAATLGNRDSLLHAIKYAWRDDNMSAAMDYFTQLSTNYHRIFPAKPHGHKAILLGLLTNSHRDFSHENKILDTNQKIDCYFQICADILMDLENFNRFYCCRFISSNLMALFPDEEARPDIIKNWFTIDTNNRSLERKEKYFPIFTREGVRTTMLQLANAAKERLLERNNFAEAIALFDQIKKTPASPQDEVQQLIEAFLLPFNINTKYHLPANNEKVREKQLAQLAQLKALALSGEPAAIAFYRGLLYVTPSSSTDMKFGYGISCDCLEKQKAACEHTCLPSEFLAQAKEIALQIKDPYLLMSIFHIKTDTLFLDFEDAFFCLREAAKMDGVDAARAAYCLTMFYGGEMMYKGPKGPEYPATPPYFRMMTWDVLLSVTKKRIRDEQGIKMLRDLENIGSILATEILLFIDYELAFNEEKTIADIFSDFREKKKFVSRPVSNKKEFCKEQFDAYFSLALNKSIDLGLINAHILFLSDHSFNLFDLIDLKEKIELDDNHLPYFANNYYKDNYCELFKEHSNKGKNGAKYIYARFLMNENSSRFNPHLAHQLLNEILETPFVKNSHDHSIVAKAADYLVECHAIFTQNGIPMDDDYDLENKAIALGSIKHAYHAAADAFEEEPQNILAYFNKLTESAPLHDVHAASENKIRTLQEITQEEEEPLDTTEKIENHFYMCMDILMDMTNPHRFKCCQFITQQLQRLFPNSAERPAHVNAWFLIDTKNITVERRESYFPLHTQADVRKTLDALMLSAKQCVPNNELRYESPSP